MKLIYLLFCCLVASVLSDQSYNAPPSTIQSQTPAKRRRRQVKQACLIIIATYYQTNTTQKVSDYPIECVLHADDRKRGARHKVVTIKGLTAKWAKKNKITSGESTLFAMNSSIDDFSSELIVPPNATLKLGRRKRWYTGSNAKIGDRAVDSYGLRFSRAASSGVKTVLVIRVILDNYVPYYNEYSTSDLVFGSHGDQLNMKSQFPKCSYGQLQFVPLTSHALVGSDGVYTVNLPNTSEALPTTQIVWEAVDKAALELNAAMTDIADFVMLVMPTYANIYAEPWAAYAYPFFWLSVYKDGMIEGHTVQMHEVGHNLGLGHSGIQNYEYGDGSCTMGYTTSFNHNYPLKCFNGVMTWQLGWFSAFHVDLTYATGFSWTGNLIGFVEMGNADADDKMIIRIQSNITDTYVHFNRAIGFNNGTQDIRDQVAVTTVPSGSRLPMPILAAKLGTGVMLNSTYAIPNFNGTSSTLMIIVNSLDTLTIPAKANVSIVFSLSPTQPPSRAPTTMSPTPVPTSKPTTQSPTPAPTPVPTSKPTTQSPTPTPTPVPTSARPSHAPTPAPTPVPTTARPSHAPTPGPTFSPTASIPPTFLPTQFPSSDAPQDQPALTQAPSLMPIQRSSLLQKLVWPTRKPSTLKPTSF